MDFFDKGYTCVQLFDPVIASNVWQDVDKDEIRKLLEKISNKPWEKLSFQRTPSFAIFVEAVNKVSIFSSCRLRSS